MTQPTFPIRTATLTETAEALRELRFTLSMSTDPAIREIAAQMDEQVTALNYAIGALYSEVHPPAIVEASAEEIGERADRVIGWEPRTKV
jgi:hypothetical protein